MTTEPRVRAGRDAGTRAALAVRQHLFAQVKDASQRGFHKPGSENVHKTGRVYRETRWLKNVRGFSWAEVGEV